jgi:hypothetical protein
MAQERLAFHMHEALCSQETRPHRQTSGQRAWRTRPTRGGKTHLASGRIAATGSLAGLRLCMVLHVGNSGGGAGWAAGQIGEPAHPGQRVSAKGP